MSARSHPALSKLAREISLNRPFESLHEAALLAYVWTWQRMEQVGREFFERFDLTGAQFDVLMILADYPGRAFRQYELAQMLLVNRATAGSVLERMDRKGLVARSADLEDRRAMRVTLTRKGQQRLNEVKPHYYALMKKMLDCEDEKSLHQVISFCDRLRDAIARLQTA